MIWLAAVLLVLIGYVGGWPHVLACLFGCFLGWAAVQRHEGKTRDKP